MKNGKMKKKWNGKKLARKEHSKWRKKKTWRNALRFAKQMFNILLYASDSDWVRERACVRKRNVGYGVPVHAPNALCACWQALE